MDSAALWGCDAADLSAKALAPACGMPGPAERLALQRPPTAACEQLLELHEQLREISEIEEHLRSGAKAEPLQLSKLQRKQEVCEQVQWMEDVAAQEAAVRQQEQTVSLQAAPLQREGWTLQPALQPDMDAGWAVLQTLVAPVSLAVCEPAPLWHASDCSGFSVHQVQVQQWAEVNSEVGQQEVPWLSQSAKRRLRRHRAARRCEASCLASLPDSATSSDAEAEAKSCEELTAGLEAGGEARAAALAALQGTVLRRAFAPAGCRVVQLALEVADRKEAAQLLTELHGHVRTAVESPHANYVVQKVVEVMPTALSGFVAEELRGRGGAVARHRFGCRIICRLLEHSGGSSGLAELLGEVLAASSELCRHPFGHHVVQSILEHGQPAHRHHIAAVLSADTYSYAQHSCASHIVEAALLHCSAEDRSTLAAGLVSSGRSGLVSLAQSQFGSFVVKAFVRQPGEASRAAWGHLQLAVAQVEATKHGQRLLRDLGLSPVAGREETDRTPDEAPSRLGQGQASQCA